jgi:hypothetical protein
MSGLMRATLPSIRVARPSLKLTLDHSTRIATSPGGRSSAANGRTPRSRIGVPSGASSFSAT